MHEFWQYGLIALISFSATLIGSMSGGGSSLIATPLWLMLGFPLPVALSSNMVSGALWSIVAARTYLRGHDVDWRLIRMFIGLGLAGAFVGTKAITLGDVHILKRIFGFCITLVVALAYFKKDFGLNSHEPRLSRWQTSLFALPLGFYESFFGSGNGFFTSAVLTSARGFVLLEALGYYYTIACVWCIFASTIYVTSGHYDLKLIIPGLSGSVLGAALGSRLGKKHGSKFVKNIFMAIGGILGLKLLLGF